MASQDVHSPSHIAMTGHDFSPEDIQALLGIPYGDNDQHNSEDGTCSQNGISQNGEAGGAGESEDSKSLSRTERKRKLEKQRRSDVNKQFSELQAALRQIESEAPEQVHGLPAYSPSNRVDLIARTIALLQNLHKSHKRCKRQVEDLEEQLAQSKKAGEEAAAKLKDSMLAPQAIGNNKVMMMVPMMIGGDGNPVMMQQWMPGYGMPGMPQHAAPPSAAAPPAENGQTTMVMPQMMPPWMMSHPSAMWTMPNSSSMPTMNSANNDSQKKSSSSSNQQHLGGNLAHCA